MRKVDVGLKIVVFLSLVLLGKTSFGASSVDTAKANHIVQSRVNYHTGEAGGFWNRTNLALFGGVAMVRLLDYTSTRDFRSRQVNEWLLSDSIVDNKPLFAGIEVSGIAASIAISYLLYRTGHHKLERWVSILHITAGGLGDIRNYSLARGSPVGTAP